MGTKAYIIITDLDASLLDGSYSYKDAIDALDVIHEEEIPLVLNSSKTLSEMLVIADKWRWKRKPILIGENGATLAFPKLDSEGECWSKYIKSTALLGDYFCVYDPAAYERILSISNKLRINHSFKFEGFSDLSAESLSDLTGLNLQASKNAKNRYATEPILWHSSLEDWQYFKQKISAHGIKAVRGGKFFHLMESGYDKAIGMTSVLSLFKNRYPNVDWKTFAIGDSPNDRLMLEQSNLALVIPNAEKGMMALRRPDYYSAKFYASKGWNSSVLEILNLSLTQI
tara:strand:- start:561 stop:1415 length:855 start_codon:yes stop_codon:yes gene_type:complete